MKLVEAADRFNEQFPETMIRPIMDRFKAALEADDLDAMRVAADESDALFTKIAAAAKPFLDYTVQQTGIQVRDRKIKRPEAMKAVIHQQDRNWIMFYRRLNPELQRIMTEDAYKVVLLKESPMLIRFAFPTWNPKTSDAGIVK